MRKSAIALLLAAFAAAPLFAGEHGESSGRHREGGLPAVEQRAWRTECGACHIAYHPAFLPERSWRKVMADLEHHFGENAGLDAPTAKQIADFLAANAADRADSRRDGKVAASIPNAQTPLRISATPWFERKHDEVRAAVWKRKSIGSAANCAACHPGAEGNRYDEHEIRIPG
jgi:hypothetical protein